MNSAKVVVIGAGPSGIAAATKLLELGFQKVALIEAENRVGGRICTIPFGENVVDMGAQWCHGEKDNVVYELAKEHNLLESTGDVLDIEFIRSNKEVLPQELIKRLKGVTNETVATRETDLVNYEGSLGSYVTEKFFGALRKPENSDIDMTIAKEYFESYQKYECTSEASDTLNDVSGKRYGEFWECEGDQLLNWKDKGYRRFLQLLMKSSDNYDDLGVLSDRVSLRKQVQQIRWGNKEKPVIVKCENNELIEADHVITTVSLGVLKEKHRDLFDPNLPEKKVRAIDGIGFGTVNKFFIEFPEKFWPDDWVGFNILWREEDLEKIRGTEDAWHEGVLGFYFVKHQPKVMNGWIVGPQGRHMETLPENVVLEGCMKLFRKFLKWDIPTPVNFKRSSWHENKNFRGSYSFQSVLTEKMETGAADLVTPLTDDQEKPLVLFAGEATNEHRHSTVHGAVESGWREAERLAKFYENKDSKSA